MAPVCKLFISSTYRDLLQMGSVKSATVEILKWIENLNN